MILYLNLFALMVLLLWPCMRIIIKGVDIFHPINFVSLMVLIGYLIPAIMIIDNPDIRGYSNLSGFVVNHQLIQEALFISSICFASLFCGFYLKIGAENRLVQSHYVWVYNKQKLLMLYLTFVAVAVGSSFLSYLLLGPREVRGVGYEYGYGYLQPLSALGFTAFAFYYSFFHYGFINTKYRTTLHLLVLSLAAFSFVTSGSRGGVLAYLLVFILARHYIYKKLSVVNVLGLFVTLFSLVIYLGLGRFNKSADVSLLDIAKNLYLQTFAGLESLMVVINRIPADVDYYWGMLGFGANTFPLFPRAIFSDKPAVYGYDLFWEEYISLISVGQTQQFLSLPGQFYADFGLLGVIFGGFITGIFLKKIYLNFLRNIRDPGVIMVYLLFITLVLQGLVFGAPTLYLFIQSFLIPLLGLRWARDGKIYKINSALAVR